MTVDVTILGFSLSAIKCVRAQSSEQEASLPNGDSHLTITITTMVSTTKKPYLGMTGTKLNAWVSVACITAMTLFGRCFSCWK